MTYLPLWRVRCGAKAILGDKAKVWRRAGRYYVGKVVASRPDRSRIVRIYGEGADWCNALSSAERAAKLEATLNPSDKLSP